MDGASDTEAVRGQGLAFRPLAALTPAQRARARSIYEESFPVRQRTPFDELLAADDDYTAEAAVLGDDVVGIAFASSLESVGWHLLEYMAIAPGRRGGGLGGAVWEHVAEGAARAGASGVVLEVEDPEEHGIDADERQTRERRISFWERCGAGRLPVPRYVVPNLDDSGTEPLVLMASPADAATATPVLAALVRAIYTEAYGLAPDDPLVVTALGTLPSR